MLSRLAVAAFCTFAIAAGTEPPAAPIQDERAASQASYLIGRWTWSTPIGAGAPASGAISFAADHSFEAGAMRGNWTLRPISDSSFEVMLAGGSTSRRLVLRMINATTMLSETEGLTYLKVQ